jgi:hypothetical protein
MPPETEAIGRDGPEFRLALLQSAVKLIHEAFAAGRTDSATRLYKGNSNDTLATQAALLSAWESFRNQIGDAAMEIGDPISLAGAFIHLACNRMRRSEYHAGRMAEQVSRANARDSEGGSLPFDPADPAQTDDFLKILTLEIEEVLSTRSPRDRLVIESQMAGYTYKEIIAHVAKELPQAKGLSEPVISRIVESFRDEMRWRLRDG